MAKKKSEQVGRGLGLVVSLAVLVALLAAAVLPLFLLFRYLQHCYLSFRLRKDYNTAENRWWLAEEEKTLFKKSHATEKARLAKNRQEYTTLGILIATEHQKASEADVPINIDGCYSRRSHLGREIQGRIEELTDFRQALDLNEYEITCRQPVDFWNELNDLLKKQNVAFIALLGWVCGAVFFYSSYKQGAPFGLWLDLFAPALCAGVGAGLAALFSRNPAVRYMAQPAIITIENVDHPEMRLPQKSGFALKLAGISIWLALVFFAGSEGRKYGAKEAISYQSRIQQQEMLSAENERKMEGIRGLDHTEKDSDTPISVEPQPVVTPRIGTVKDALIAVPSDESPLDGQDVVSELESESEHASAPVLKALPVIDESSPATQGNLNQEEIEGWNLARVKTEINTIYARHGVVFANKELQKWATQQPGYRPVSGLTFEQAEEGFSVKERHDIEALAARRELILRGNQELGAPEPEELPDSDPLDPSWIATWDAARVRTEINAIYARYGVDFDNRELNIWVSKQLNYKRVPGRTFADAEALFSNADRKNIELLAARRSQLSSGGR